MNLGKIILSPVFSMLIFFNPVTARAFNFADYMPSTLGNYWTYRNGADPTDTFTVSVFEKFTFAGNPALKIGTDLNNYNIGHNDGTSVNIYASVDNGVLNDFGDVSIGEITDGMFINLVEPTNFALFRLWDNLNPLLTSVYNIDPSLTDLILWVTYDSNFLANSQNSIVKSNLGVSLPNYAVTGLVWYQQGVGEIVRIDVDAATGTIGDRYDLIDYKVNYGSYQEASYDLYAANYPHSLAYLYDHYGFRYSNPTYRYYAWYYANDAQNWAYEGYLDSPGSSYTQYYSYYTWLYLYYASLYRYYTYLGYDYSDYTALYAYYGQYYLGLAALYASWRA